MAEWLKRGKAAEADDARSEATRTLVRGLLDEIRRDGDAAIRRMSLEFDGYERRNFRLSPSEIEAAMNRVTTREMEDIKFA